MSEARGRTEWNQTSALMAVICNLFHDPKKGKPATPDQFNPYHERKPKKQSIPKVPITVLRDVFCKEK